MLCRCRPAPPPAWGSAGRLSAIQSRIERGLPTSICASCFINDMARLLLLVKRYTVWGIIPLQSYPVRSLRPHLNTSPPPPPPPPPTPSLPSREKGKKVGLNQVALQEATTIYTCRGMMHCIVYRMVSHTESSGLTRTSSNRESSLT